MNTFALRILATVFVPCLPVTVWGQGTFSLTYEPFKETDQLVGMIGQQILRPTSTVPSLKAPPKDVTGTLTYYSDKIGGRELLVIVQSAPRRIYVDTDFDSDFSDETPLSKIPTTQPATATSTLPFGRGDSYGPVSIRIPSDTGEGTTTTKVIIGVHHGGTRYVLRHAGWFTGTVTAGGQSYRVALNDANLDGRYDSVFSLPYKPEKGTTFDFLAVDLDKNGRFEFGNLAKMEILPLAKRIQLGDTYYAVKPAADGSSITLTKTDFELGTLDVGTDDAELVLFSDCGMHRLEGSGGKWRLPPSKYMGVMLSFKTIDENGKTWTLQAAGPQMGTLQNFRVRAGKTTSFKLGPPLRATTDVRQGSGRRVSIGLSLVGQAGEGYAPRVSAKGHVPRPPKLNILDENGKTLATGTFEFG